ncbi:MAG: NADP-dependent oxidoreductase [Pirellulaceae bacterium]
MTHREIYLTSRPDGVPTADNFELVSRPMPQPRAGEILVRNAWMSVDPYMRGRMREGSSYVEPFELGTPMEGGCVGEVIETKCDKFAKGDWVLGKKGWRDYWCSDGDGVFKVDPKAAPLQSYLGILGMTGMTAYVGLRKIGRIREGDRVFVSAASGAVGSVVCQIAKIKKCHVVGSAGSAAKVQWLKSKAGIDAAFNYHDVDDLSATLQELCPAGIDVYFDNVGARQLEAAIDNMNDFGRIVACGMISSYNENRPQPGPQNLFKVIVKRLRMEGFIVGDHFDMLAEFQREMGQWIQTGKMVWEDTVTEGLENAPQAFINLFNGDKMGKALVKL